MPTSSGSDQNEQKTFSHDPLLTGPMQAGGHDEHDDRVYLSAPAGASLTLAVTEAVQKMMWQLQQQQQQVQQAQAELCLHQEAYEVQRRADQLIAEKLRKEVERIAACSCQQDQAHHQQLHKLHQEVHRLQRDISGPPNSPTTPVSVKEQPRLQQDRPSQGMAIAIMMDCTPTNPMAGAVEACKEQVSILQQQLQQERPQAKVTVAFIGYTDASQVHGSRLTLQNLLPFHRFAEDGNASRQPLSSLLLKGLPEDLLGACKGVHDFFGPPGCSSGKAETRVVVHFHAGSIPEDITRQLAGQDKFRYYFIDVKPWTSFRMTDIVTGPEQYSGKHNRAFHALPCRSLPLKFLPTVLRAVHVSSFKGTACLPKNAAKVSSPFPAVPKYDGCDGDYDIVDDLDFF